MQAINRDATEDALRLIDESHTQALDDRRTLQSAEAALRDLQPVPHEGRGTLVGPLARRLGIRPATLRKWERAGLVQPRRDPQTGYRVYSAADVRDALLAHQLRRGGYLLEQIAPLIAQVRSAGGIAPLESMLRDWHARLSARSRAMLTGAAALDAYLGCLPPPPGDRPSDSGSRTVAPVSRGPVTPSHEIARRGDSRVFAGHAAPVSISVMRHKSWGLRQLASMPNPRRGRALPLWLLSRK